MRRTLLVAAVLVAPGCQLVFAPDTDGGDDGPSPDAPSATIRFAEPIPVAGLPVPIRLDPGALDLSDVTDYKEDLRFVAGGRDRPFEIEHWNPDGESVVWVLPPALAEEPNDELTMYYGSGAGGAADAAAVWGPGYAAVWHLSDSSGPATTVFDSTGNYPGTGSEPTFESGAIGRARTFGTSASGPVTFAGSEELFGGWSEMTLELFILPRSTGTWIEQGAPLDEGAIDDATAVYTTDLTFYYENCDCWSYASMPTPPSGWTYLAYAYDGTAMTWFLDAEAQYTDEAIGPSLTYDRDTLALGSTAGTTFDGAIDEIRISNVYRDSEYIHWAYTVADPAFVTIEP